MMRAFTVRDTRTYHPHKISLINLQSSTFIDLQRHPAKGEIAAASFLGLLGEDGDIRNALSESYEGAGGNRLTAEEWAHREAELRNSNLTDEEIAVLRKAKGPRDTGLAGLRNVPSRSIELCASRPMVERAALFDSAELQRLKLTDVQATLLKRNETAAAHAIELARQRSFDLGIEEMSVTWEFPIAMAAFGYTRTVKSLGEGTFHGFAKAGQYEGKYPIFAVASNTEAVMISLSATTVLRWLIRNGLTSDQECGDVRTSKLAILDIFARRDSDPEGPEAIEILLHSMSHVLLKALDDGQIGFAEASMAEWLVPEALTFALYANNLKSYTLGALWTLLSNRSLQWLDRAVESVFNCENDPLCHQRTPRACERCLFVAFGCQRFNDGLDRRLIADFWRNA